MDFNTLETLSLSCTSRLIEPNVWVSFHSVFFEPFLHQAITEKYCFVARVPKYSVLNLEPFSRVIGLKHYGILVNNKFITESKIIHKPTCVINCLNVIDCLVFAYV